MGTGNQNRRIVQPQPDGRWEVTKPGSSRASVVTDTQRQAIDAGRPIVANAGGGELQIRGRDGRIRDSDTVPPGNDPFPPRDTKH
jgi:Uncharacterized protein conserved in bacteria (DUF2188)